MTNKTLQHNPTVSPENEAAVKEYLIQKDVAASGAPAKKVNLAELYPQRANRDEPYGRYAPIDLDKTTVIDEPDVSQLVNWRKLALLGCLIPLPFFVLDIIMVTFVGMFSISSSVVVAMIAIPYILFFVLMAYIVRHYFNQIIEALGLNVRMLFWSTVLFALPVIGFVRLNVATELMDGKMPPLPDAILYVVATIGIVVASLLGFTFLLYRYRGNYQKRLRAIVLVALIPYLIGLIMVIDTLIQLFQPVGR